MSLTLELPVTVRAADSGVRLKDLGPIDTGVALLEGPQAALGMAPSR